MFEKEVNERITKIRKQRKLSKRDIAKQLNIKYSTYVRTEAEGGIKTYTLKRLAEILDVNVREILYGSDFKKEDKPIPKSDITVIHGYKYKDDFISVMEFNIINILRNFNKTDRQKVLDLINELYSKKRSG